MKSKLEDDLRPEYDLKALRVRRVGAERMKRGDVQMNDEYMSDELFDELLVSVREGGEILRGEQDVSRRFELDSENKVAPMVKLDEDVWAYFQSAESVNEALRLLIQVSQRTQQLQTAVPV